MSGAAPVADGPRPGRTLLAVAAGGALGGAARVAAGASSAALAPALPAWAVLVAVNVLGCFVMGLVVARGRGRVDPLVTTGVLGGFTSFSGWVLDVVRLAEPAPALALLLLLAVPLASVAACLVGLLAGGERP
ncbi:CrcB family protein [Jannaschia sp. R86511]|uniref:FluC/FEX family fluoride channel n=1 Tax=Jannaschia sp. R86511 TaxID=3093853 RepID=UPI0036D3AFCA